MIASVFGGHRRRPWTALCVGLLTSVAAQTASAADCPGHPDAIGTSRTIVVDPRAHPLIGTMQYGKTLPLEDHEVVLTFDDGPLPKPYEPKAVHDYIRRLLTARTAKRG